MNLKTQHVYLELLLEKRLWGIFLLGICSGFPWVLIGSAMTGWLTDAGLSRTAIGIFGSIFFVYSINFLWAPFVDRFQIPLLQYAGHRKSWIVLMLCLMTLCCAIISTLKPESSLLLLSGIALLIAISSATQDIAIDAYRVNSIDNQKEAHLLPYGAAAATGGWWTGYSVLGAAAFFLKGYGMLWADIYLVLAGFCFVMALIVMFLLNEKAIHRHEYYQQVESALGTNHRGASYIYSTVVYPFVDLFKRYGTQVVLLLLAFLFTFKMGEAFLGRMSITFYKEIGFSDIQIAKYSKLVTWGVTIVFSLLGAFVNMRLGIFKGLLIGGLTMALTNLMFAWISSVGPNEQLFFWTVILDGFTSAFATVVLVSFITHLTSQVFSATQYALLASVANFGRTVVSSSSGWLVDLLAGDWTLFFIITTLMVLPSLLILAQLFRVLRKQNVMQ